MKPAAGRARRGTANREVPSAPPLGAAQPLWPTEAQGPALHALAVCASLLLAVAIVFGRTVRYQFVNFDDCQYVYHNKHVLDGLTRSGIAWAFSHFYASNWHPLTWISHMLDCQCYGLWPGGHHLTNVLLHAVTAVLLFLVLRQMTGRLWPAALAAAIFALHPLRVESVAWVAERKDVLSGLFFVLALWAYVAYAGRPFSLVRYALVVLLYALGLMAKPILVTLPALLVLLDYWPLGRLGNFSPGAWGLGISRVGRAQRAPPGNGLLVPGGARDRASHGAPRPTLPLSSQPERRSSTRPLAEFRPWLEKLPLLALSAASCVVTLLAQRETLKTIDEISFPARIANALVAYAAYLEQMVCPVSLAALYPHPRDGLPAWKVAGAILLLAVITLGVLRWGRRRPYLLVGWLWYLGMLVPVIGLVQVGEQAMADRYTYLSQIGLCLLIAWVAADLVAHLRCPAWACGSAALLVLAAMAAAAWQQTAYWQDSEALWAHALDCNSQNYTAHYNIGCAMQYHRRLVEAAAHFHEALKIEPRHADTHVNLGLVLADCGQPAAAIAHYDKALELDHDNAAAHNNLGSALARLGRTGEATAHLRRALEIDPDYAEAHTNLGNVLLAGGQVDDAIAEFRWALRIDPDYGPVHNNLGVVLASQGRIEEAIAEYRAALKVEPDYAAAYVNLGRTLAGLGQVDEAVACYRKALQIEPASAAAHFNLADALGRQGKFPDALLQLRAAARLAPTMSKFSTAWPGCWPPVPTPGPATAPRRWRWPAERSSWRAAPSR